MNQRTTRRPAPEGAAEKSGLLPARPAAAEAPRYDFRILVSLRRIIRAVDIHSLQLRTQHKVTGPQLVCLHWLLGRGPMTTTSLARAASLSAATVTGIVDRLEAAGLARRERDVEDRRIVRVEATEAGRRLAARAPSPLQDKLAAALARLPELEQATLALSLERIVDLMEARDLDAAPILETRPLAEPASPTDEEGGR